jgi:hypothetical protein
MGNPGAPFRFRSLDEWDRLSPRTRDSHERSVQAKRDMLEHGLSRREALGKYHLDARTFNRHVGSGVEKRGSRWVARRGDRIPAVMSMNAAGSDTKVRVFTRSAAERRLVGQHDRLVRDHRRLILEGSPPGKTSAQAEREIRERYAKFEGRTIDGKTFAGPAEIEDKIATDRLESEGPYDDEAS